MKKIVALVCALVLMAVAVSALAEAAVVGTYVCTFTTEDLAGVTDMNGFVSGMGLTERNEIVLYENGTYVYTKKLGNLDENGEVTELVAEGQAVPGALMIYVYTGTYTQEGDKVTLNVPDDCTFSEDWGALVGLGFMKNSEGKASEGAIVTNYESHEYDPMDNFSNPVYKFDGHDLPVNVTVNADGTFTYIAAANSDDD